MKTDILHTSWMGSICPCFGENCNFLFLFSKKRNKNLLPAYISYKNRNYFHKVKMIN